MQEVQTGTAHHEPEWGMAQEVVEAACEVVATVVAALWRAPLVMGAAGWAAYDLWLWWIGDLAAAGVLLAGPVTAVLALWLVRPEWVARLRSVLVGQWLRVAVYRPRWETAVMAAGVVTRMGRRVDVPRLREHHHTRQGRDVLVVRCAAGQTLADWEAACPSLASTFTAHSVRARAASRPGWVVLDVLRRDPLAGEVSAPNPARRPASGPLVLGVDEHGNAFGFDPTATAHAALQGATRSGKSSTCYTVLAGLAHRLDVVVAGVDPSGILLAPFTTGRGAPFIATGTRPEDLDHAVTALAGLIELMDDRIRDLLAQGLDKITDFTPAVPAVWIVLEEYPGLLAAAKALDAQRGAKPGDRLAPRLETAVGRLVKEGAKVGVLVLAIAQRMSADAIKTDDRMNLALRITHRVDNTDAVAMLHEGLSRDQAVAVRGFAPGVALAEQPGHDLRRVRMHHTSYAHYRTRVAKGLVTHAGPALGCHLTGEVVSLAATTSGEVGTTGRGAA